MYIDQDIILISGRRQQDEASFYAISTIADAIIERCVVGKGKGGYSIGFSTYDIRT